MAMLVERVWCAHHRCVGALFDCPRCGGTTTARAFGAAAGGSAAVSETGDFAAACPHCGQRRKWFLDDGRPSHARRQFPRAFRDRFCAAVADGLPLAATGPEVYCGVERIAAAGDDARGAAGPELDVVAHVLKSEIDATRRVVYLPRSAAVTAARGQRLAGGDVWARAFGRPPGRAWGRRHRDDRWAALSDACGGGDRVGLLQRLWFDHQLVRLRAASDRVLLPADLSAGIVRDVPPVDLWWDTGPALPHYDWETQSCAFPPVRLRRWDALRHALPGDVGLVAGIVDPRFSAAGRSPVHVRGRVRPDGNDKAEDSQPVRRSA